jgi:hypothetical protein
MQVQCRQRRILIPEPSVKIQDVNIPDACNLQEPATGSLANSSRDTVLRKGSKSQLEIQRSAQDQTNQALPTGARPHHRGPCVEAAIVGSITR